MNILREIKYAYQRVRYGFDERIYWELDSYFEQFIPAIKKFCENELAEEWIDFNPKRKKVFKRTLKLIKELEEPKAEKAFGYEAEIERLWSYVGGNITIYWN
jgi:hypothetical protein